MQRIWLVMSVVWAGWGCDTASNPGRVDGALVDAGRPGGDAQRPDAGPRDQGVDARVVDAGPPHDADVPRDMARLDATTIDGGHRDAALVDGGGPDGHLADAEALDAAPSAAAELDAAEPDGAPLDAATLDAAPLDAAPVDAALGPLEPPILTELAARNGGEVLDEDGEPSDWIELYNPGDAPYPLNNHHLTDTLEEPTRWRFPRVFIPPHSYLVVFASGKDRKAGELHTDFNLAGDGETVALTDPNGAVISAIVDYPLQAAGLSFGLPMTIERTPFVAPGTVARLRIPAAADPIDWYGPEQADGEGWVNAAVPVGDDRAGPPRAPVVVSDSAGAFSGAQGRAGWSYGYWDATQDNHYDPEDFQAFPAGAGPFGAANFWTGQTWDWFGGDPPFTQLTASGGQPNGRNHGPLHHAVRRYVSPLTGTLELSGQVGNPAAVGDGAIGRIFVEGDPVFARLVDGTTEAYSVRVSVNAGDRIDFAIDPGAAGDDTGDGTIFSARIILPGQGVDARGPLVADSYAEWSADGVQGENGWTYGASDRTADGDGQYGVADFRAFPRAAGARSVNNFWTGEVWDWFPSNPPWTLIGRELMHPSGTNSGPEHWAIRRWQADVAGDLIAEWTLSKAEAAGGGVTGRLFHQGVEVDHVTLEGDDQVGVVRTAVLLGVQPGDFIDVAVDPHGTDGDTTDVSDATQVRLRLWPAVTVAETLQSDIGDLRGEAPEVRLRMPFVVDAAAPGRLLLTMRYDDGFRAWLDGVLVAFDNAPARVDRTTGEALTPVTRQVGRDLPPGPHLLAVAGYDAPGADGTSLIDPRLEAVQLDIEPAAQYLPVPTPGADNVARAEDEPPFVVDLSGNQDVGPADEIDVQARVVAISAPIAQVTLVHRVRFGAEERTLMMPDGRDTWRLTLPPAAAGELVRWYVVATDIEGRSARYPPFEDALDSAEYLGTVVRDDSIVTELPTLHWFAANPAAAATDAGTRTTLWFEGELYDNIRADLHGQSTRGFPKKSYNLDFNADHRFRLNDELPRMRDINLLTNYADKSKLRNTMGYGIYRDAGADYHLAFSVRMHLNGRFFSVADFVEDGDDKWLERLGYPEPVGALYKMYDNMSSTVRGEKKTRKDEGTEDLNALINGLGLEAEARRLFIYDNVDLARMANFLAAMIVNAGLDCCHKNYYAYRDNRTDEWWYMIWDVDLCLGRNWTGNYFDDRMYPQNPLYVGGGNRLIGALFALPEFNEMYLRRLRTLIDTLVQPPGTPPEALLLENSADALRTHLGADGDLDNSAWPTWGTPQTVDEAVRIMKTDFLGPRRLYFYNQLVQRPPQEFTVLVDGEPGAAQARYFVPVDDRLGDGWTAPGFDDGAWAEGPMSIGYEDVAAEYNPYVATRVRPSEVNAQATNVLVRLHFAVDDPEAMENLILRLRYDDGVVVWLNGVEVTRRGLDAGLVGWNANAANHDDAAAIVWEDQDIQAFAALLVPGDNVLAARIVNAGAGSSDLLLGLGLVNGLPGGGGPIPEAQAAVQVDVETLEPAPGAPREGYVVLHNRTGAAVDLTGWRLFGGGIEHAFTVGTVIPTDGRLYVAADVRAFRARRAGPAGGQGLFVQGNWSGALVRNGRVALVAP